MSGNDFWTSGTGTGNGKFHSHFRERECECEWQIPFPFSGTGMQINRKFHSRLSGTENSREIPGKFHSHLRERECKWKIPFPFSGTGMRVANSIPDFRDGNWRPVFPGIPGIGNSRSWLPQQVENWPEECKSTLSQRENTALLLVPLPQPWYLGW